MRRPSLLAGIAFAFAVSLFAVPVWWSLKETLPYTWAVRTIVVGSCFAYCVYLLTLAGARIGNLTLSATNLALAIGLLSLPASNSMVAAGLVALVTLNRSLLFHRSMISIALDGSISVVGLTFAGYLFNSTWNLPAAVWGYFLLQSVFVVIPPRFSLTSGAFSTEAEDLADPFRRSRRQAEAALHRMVRNDHN